VLLQGLHKRLQHHAQSSSPHWHIVNHAALIRYPLLSNQDEFNLVCIEASTEVATALSALAFHERGYGVMVALFPDVIQRRTRYQEAV
jgi:adenosyl cobinamide kinase/adenosyl cobinamide phosphate guanylyltransferase